jgi:hypothetical protein
MSFMAYYADSPKSTFIMPPGLFSSKPDFAVMGAAPKPAVAVDCFLDAAAGERGRPPLYRNAMFDSLASNIRFYALTIGTVAVELSLRSGIYCAQSGVSQWAKCTMPQRSDAA